MVTTTTLATHSRHIMTNQGASSDLLYCTLTTLFRKRGTQALVEAVPGPVLDGVDTAG